MTILDLMNRVRKRFEDEAHPFVNRNLAMRRGYLTGLAMLAHADGEVKEEERDLFLKIAEALDVSPQLANEIMDRALQSSEDTVLEIRENLIESKHRYYFVLDMLIMSHQDGYAMPVEKEVISRFAELLEIDSADLAFLSDLAEALVEKDPEKKEAWRRGFFEKRGQANEVEPDDFTFYTHEENFEDRDT